MLNPVSDSSAPRADIGALEAKLLALSGVLPQPSSKLYGFRAFWLGGLRLGGSPTQMRRLSTASVPNLSEKIRMHRTSGRFLTHTKFGLDWLVAGMIN